MSIQQTGDDLEPNRILTRDREEAESGNNVSEATVDANDHEELEDDGRDLLSQPGNPNNRARVNAGQPGGAISDSVMPTNNLNNSADGAGGKESEKQKKDREFNHFLMQLNARLLEIDAHLAQIRKEIQGLEEQIAKNKARQDDILIQKAKASEANRIWKLYGEDALDPEQKKIVEEQKRLFWEKYGYEPKGDNRDNEIELANTLHQETLEQEFEEIEKDNEVKACRIDDEKCKERFWEEQRDEIQQWKQENPEDTNVEKPHKLLKNSEIPKDAENIKVSDFGSLKLAKDAEISEEEAVNEAADASESVKAFYHEVDEKNPNKKSYASLFNKMNETEQESLSSDYVIKSKPSIG